MPDAPRIRVHVQEQPPWATDDVDIERALFTAAPEDDNTNLLDVAWTAGGDGMRMRYAEGATFWVGADLDEIWLTYDPPLTAADAAHFLLEPVLAFVLRRRGVLVFHASAVAFDGKAVVFCGPAGAGKSTTAGVCVRAGGALMSDDVVAVAETAGQWLAHVGTAEVRVWHAGVEALIDDPDRAPRFSATWDKRLVSPALLGGHAAMAPVPIALVCTFAARSDSADAPRLVPVTGRAAVQALLPNTAANYAHDRVRRAEELGQLAGLMSRVPVARLVAHTDPLRIPGIVDLLRRQLAG